VGKKLVADFTYLPDLVFAAIKERRYNTVSAEVFWNLKRGGGTYRRALKAVALLGAELPAVAGLRPLHEMFTGFESDAIKCASDTTFDALPDRGPAPSNNHPNGATMSAEALKEMSDKVAALEARTKAAEDAAKAAKDENERVAREYAQRTAQLEEQARVARVGAIAATCRLPALRPFVSAFADLASRMPQVKVFDAEGKEQEAPKVVEAFIKQVNETTVAKLFAVESNGTPAGKPDGTDDDKPASTIVDERTKKHMAEKGVKSYADAMRAVLDEDPALKQRYATVSA
jgi:hypothetical protein